MYDVIIAGTGVAGLFTALHLPQNKKVLMITKDKLEHSDSYLAQGGISVLKNARDYGTYFEDTMKAGHYENRMESVKVMINSSRKIIAELVSCGVEFDRTADGKYSYTKEGAHSVSRILHHKDQTGKEITSKLLEQAKKRPNIEIAEYTEMVDLLCKDNSCYGMAVKRPEGTYEQLQAKVVVLATGGIGGLFRNTTNYSHITGDSFALALTHGIQLEHLNYIQVHPTAFYTEKPGRKFLISEAVRGEGAILLNRKGKRFVNELLPRDAVTDAIHKEMERENSPYVFLSLEQLEEEKIRRRFPNIYKRCLEEGYDITRERIPVTPAQHYLMGGIRIDINGQTSCRNLYAVGEAACNGVHGANRLASNSLLESLVFARRAAEKIGAVYEKAAVPVPDFSPGQYEREDRREWFQHLIMEEIKKEDEKFYVKWCDYGN